VPNLSQPRQQLKIEIVPPATAPIDALTAAHMVNRVQQQPFSRIVFVSKVVIGQRQQTGGSIHEYLLTRRIKSSCDLLRYSDESIDAIALAVGFSEVTYFITCFKKMMRQTPLQYRRSLLCTRIPC